MKALSIKEPWISLIVDGKKTIETRTRNIKYRGTILLVGSKVPVGKCSGLAVGVADIVDCRMMTKADELAACCPTYNNAHSWALANVRKIEKPFKVKGMLGLYEVNVNEEDLKFI